MTEPVLIERICVDCGEWFRLVGVLEAERHYECCGPCAWLRETTDPAERRRIRAMTHRRNMSDG